jgi:putative ATP-dependent endonuclease of the OLD family
LIKNLLLDEKAPERNRRRVRSVVLCNFKKFGALTLNFNQSLNILIGDNEAGKSSVLLAIDLALSASRSKVETLGVDALLRKGAVTEFLAGAKRLQDLPVLSVDVFLSDACGEDVYGRCNSRHAAAFGVRFSCAPSDEYGAEIADVLRQPGNNFPFEFYVPRFTTFKGGNYNPYGRVLRHLLLDSALISTDYAQREYARALYRVNASASERVGHENKYRQAKDKFRDEHLGVLNEKLEKTKFAVRSSIKSNLETDLVVTEEGIPLDSRGRGLQSLIKTEFALRRVEGRESIEVLLLEEPENHLSHGNMLQLVDKLSDPGNKQLFVATHSSLVCSRLDLRKAILLDNDGGVATLAELESSTAEFFCKAPDSHVLEYAMSKRVILVEGDAEYILIAKLYQSSTGSTLERDGVHVISVGGTSFKRYLALAKLLKIKTAIVRDNDKNYQRHCVDNYVDHLSEHTRVFADADPTRSTFEICLYEDNKGLCEDLFKEGRKALTVQDYMLANKAEAALALTEKYGDKLKAPAYVHDAMAWIRG